METNLYVEKYIAFMALINNERALLLKLLKKILDNPNCPKYCSLKKDGLKKRIEHIELFFSILKSIGFKESNDASRLEFNSDRIQLQSTHSELSSIHSQLVITPRPKTSNNKNGPAQKTDMDTINLKAMVQKSINTFNKKLNKTVQETFRQLVTEGFGFQDALSAIRASVNDLDLDHTFIKMDEKPLKEADEMVDKLVSMGFDSKKSQNALIDSNYNLEKAALKLSSNIHTNITEAKHSSDGSNERWITTRIQRVTESDVINVLMEKGHTEEEARSIINKQRAETSIHVNFHGSAGNKQLSDNMCHEKMDNDVIFENNILERNVPQDYPVEEFKDPKDAVVKDAFAASIPYVDSSRTSEYKLNAVEITEVAFSDFDTKNIDSTDILSDEIIYSRWNDGKVCQVNTCHCVRRVIDILTRYQADASDNSKIFEDKYNKVDLLNDYNHLLITHSNHFEDIYNLCKEQANDEWLCNLCDCLCWKRNDRNRSHIEEQKYEISNGKDIGDVTQQQIIDRIHCYYLHGFDTGYRISRKNKADILNDELKSYNDELYIDKTFDRVRQFLHSQNKENNLAKIGEKFIINKENASMKMDQYNYGYRFFYWDYYKNNISRFDPMHQSAGVQTLQSYGNFSFNHRGYNFSVPEANVNTSLGSWYITQKYENFKQELLQNAICTINNTAFDSLYGTALIHQQTDMVRNFLAANERAAKFYGVNLGDIMSINHLMAVMVQCNFDVLQFEFKKTYRKESCINEKDDELKKRHSNYYWLGKLLRECAECFGMNRYIDCENKYF
eukprot:485501_1